MEQDEGSAGDLDTALEDRPAADDGDRVSQSCSSSRQHSTGATSNAMSLLSEANEDTRSADGSGDGEFDHEVGIKAEKPSKPPNTNKFKITARMVKRNMALTKGLAQDAERHMKLYAVPSADGKSQEMFTFNVQSFFPECQSCSGLSARVKTILMKVAWSRTEEELEIVRRFVMKLACFSRYSLYVRQELAHVLFYDVFERGRVVIRQGDVGYSFYFIVSGSVLVQIQDKDPVSGIVRNNIVGELGAGATFGDLALLNNDKRRATIVCKEDCEFLKVDKMDFNKILMESCKESWTHSNDILSQHPLFKDWSEDSIKLAVEGSQFVEFTSNCVILKDLSMPSDHVFIVTRGKCQVIQRVSLFHTKDGIQIQPLQAILPPLTKDKPQTLKHKDNTLNQEQLLRRRKLTIVQKWWLIRTLYPGDYFGVGEGPTDSSIICVDMAECLLVNSVVLARQSQGRYLEAIRNDAKKLYPSLETAFKSYSEGKKWVNYKQRVLQQVITDLKQRKSSHTL